MDPALLDLASAQDGVLTTRQARSLGHSRQSLAALVRDGTLVRLTRGVYAAGVPNVGAMTSVVRHSMLGRGAQLLYPDGALSGHTALVALGIPVWGASLRRAHLERPIHREVLTRDLVIRPRFGGPVAHGAVVAPAVALVQHCLEHGATPGVVAADAALHAGVISGAELEDVARRVHGWPRSSRVRTMLAFVDARSESVGESRLRVALGVLGVAVEPQVVIRDESGRVVARVDFLVKGTKVVIEFDGLVKYRDGGPKALIAEKRREDELRRLGYHVVRVVWSDLERLAPIVAQLRRLGVVGHAAYPAEIGAGQTAPDKGWLHHGTVPG
jgi:hypothetical protein